MKIQNSIKLIPMTAALLFAEPLVSAQKFDWGIDFKYNLDNREFGEVQHKPYGDSQTINLLELTPVIGIRMGTDSTRIHRILAGAQLQYHFGTNEYKGLIRSLPVFYSFEGTFSEKRLFAGVGVIPTKYLMGDYSPCIFSNSYHLLEGSVQGLIINWRATKVNAELSFDWMGARGDSNHPERRERFQIISAGDWNFAGAFHLNWSGSFYHFACSDIYKNVVDNHKICPAVSWQPESALDRISIAAGGVFTYQRDRKSAAGLKTPKGLMLTQEFSKWGISIKNHFYWGEDLMPLIGMSYNGCPPYDTDLYFGEKLFHTTVNSASIVDLLQIDYEKQCFKWMAVGAAIRFHLGEKTTAAPVFRGWQQIVYLKINLDRPFN